MAVPPELTGAGARYGRLWTQAVLRPYAEQLLLALRSRPGEVILDLGDDDRITAALLRRHGLTVVTAAEQRAATVVVALRGGMVDPPPPVADMGPPPNGRPRFSLVCEWAAAPHEDALRGALGLVPLERAGGGARWPDVARFDSVDHLWAAAAGRLDIAGRLAQMTRDERNAARERLGGMLARFSTADATLRIPVSMAVH
ncbi:MAG: hypothetical protein ABR541_01130 [Candidatus Dormibacteria bacterium]